MSSQILAVDKDKQGQSSALSVAPPFCFSQVVEKPTEWALTQNWASSALWVFLGGMPNGTEMSSKIKGSSTVANTFSSG